MTGGKKMMMVVVAGIAGLLLAGVQARAQAALGEDPLRAQLHSDDARRFAVVFEQAGGQPSAEQLQRGYLDGAGRGVAIFTPRRIVDAARLARAVARRPQDYRHAIASCLPLLSALTAELRAVYLAYRGLLPSRPLPAVHVVFGAGNSGGTAQPDAQVLGLEVMCPEGTSAAEFGQRMRAIFAHETVHSWQGAASAEAERDPLLLAALREGTADYLAGLVSGRHPMPAREAWARPREGQLWREFQRDREALRATPQQGADSVFYRWFANYGRPPEGWHYEAGYWVGEQIAAAYVARAADRRAAIEALIELRDPQAILQASGYGEAAR